MMERGEDGEYVNHVMFCQHQAFNGGLRAARAESAKELAEKDAEIERLKRKLEWEPIKTAPADTCVLICGGESRSESSDEWFEDSEVRLAKRYFGDHYYMVNDYYYSRPTHWMPRPDAPATKKEG
jgi:hypothetical protein